MKPLLIKRIPLDEILNNHPIPSHILSQYLAPRPGIFDNPDIFYENCRSKNVPVEYKNFNLFQDTNENLPETIFICPIYLEVFEYAGISILNVVKQISEHYYPNRIIFQWNHDIDFASKYSDIEKFTNVFIINFNTSKPLKNDIIAPFWVINYKYIRSPIQYHFAGFIGSLNNELRRKLSNTISGKDRYYQASHLEYDIFLKRTSECLFSFCPRGQGLNSYRFFECFHIQTIPVLIADKIILPYSSEINYNEICIKIPESNVTNFFYINDILLEIDTFKMLEEKFKIRKRFTLLGLQEEIHRKLS